MAGRGKDKTDLEFLEVLVEYDDFFMSASEMADSLSYDTTKNVNRRMRELAEDNLVDGKKVGNSYAWWITEKGKRRVKEENT